ncbi:hypothetical protein [Rhodococcus sp. BE178]|uniref:hypothetical protein n=1 Tax=Rhodococcus sp. BE178 TaxID=2817737 RepID=UPI003D2242FA
MGSAGGEFGLDPGGDLVDLNPEPVEVADDLESDALAHRIRPAVRTVRLEPPGGSVFGVNWA